MLLIEQVVKTLYEEKSAIERIVLNTQNVEDFVSYKFLIGKLQGIEMAINICHGILKKLDD